MERWKMARGRGGRWKMEDGRWRERERAKRLMGKKGGGDIKSGIFHVRLLRFPFSAKSLPISLRTTTTASVTEIEGDLDRELRETRVARDEAMALVERLNRRIDELREAPQTP